MPSGVAGNMNRLDNRPLGQEDAAPFIPVAIAPSHKAQSVILRFNLILRFHLLSNEVVSTFRMEIPRAGDGGQALRRLPRHSVHLRLVAG